MTQNVVKAWHYHHVQYDWWYVALGQIEAVLYDNRPESPSYKQKMILIMGDAQEYGGETREICVRIPPGVLHGLKVLSEYAHLFYITSEVYNPEEEGRLPYNSDLVPHQWGDNVITVERDRRAFVPARARTPLR